jgi:hypothetical protein
MKVFSFFCVAFSLIFGVSNEFVKGELIQLYEDSKLLYLRGPINARSNFQFKLLYWKLEELFGMYLEKDQKGLFNILDQSANRQVVHFFFGLYSLKLDPKKPAFLIRTVPREQSGERYEIWSEHLDTSSNAAKLFFARSFSLIRILCKRDLEVAYDVLPIILSIQNRYLYHLQADRDRIEVAGWISEFGLIAHYKKWNLEPLLKLYERLRLVVRKYDEIPKEGKDIFFISNSLNLVELFCNLFYYKFWEELDGYKFTAIPRELLYLILIKFPKEKIFKLLRFPKKCSVSDFGYSSDFFNIFKGFKATLNEEEMIEYSDLPFQHPQFIYYLRSSVMPQVIHTNFSKKQMWLIKCFLHILPILKKGVPEYSQHKSAECVLI